MTYLAFCISFASDLAAESAICNIKEMGGFQLPKTNFQLSLYHTHRVSWAQGTGVLSRKILLRGEHYV